MPTNIEFKMRLAVVESVAAALRRLGAREAEVLAQRDTYFAVADGRLKLRETPGEAELIAYRRDESGPAMESRYRRTPVADATAERARLTAVYGVRGVVEKSRSLWLYGNARVHLDYVAGLGSFLEIEIVEPRTSAEGERALRELLTALALDPAAGLRASYIDLVAPAPPA